MPHLIILRTYLLTYLHGLINRLLEYSTLIVMASSLILDPELSGDEFTLIEEKGAYGSLP